MLVQLNIAIVCLYQCQIYYYYYLRVIDLYMDYMCVIHAVFLGTCSFILFFVISLPFILLSFD